MLIEQRLVEFDIRQEMSILDADWTRERRELFLLKKEVLRPLSVDKLVWHSLLNYDSPITELDVIKNVESTMNDAHTSIAIGIFTGDNSGREIFMDATPEIAEKSWSFVGYDVADSGFISGLMNCSYDPGIDDVKSMISKWSSKLNKYHLFDDINLALEFRDMTRIRVKEHDPFYVFGIWII